MNGQEATGCRVLLVCDWFLKYVGPFAEALRRAGIPVAVAIRDHAHEFGGDRAERSRVVEGMRAAGVEVIELPGRGSSLLRALPALARVRRWRADVVHAQSEIHDPRLLAAVRGLPLALMIHDPRPHLGSARRPLRLRLWQWLWVSRANLLLVHSEALAPVVGARKPVRALPHGASVRRAPAAAPSRPTVVLFGRLEYYKGVRVLLAAMDLVWEARPETLLVIAGQGPELEVVPRDPRIEVVAGYVPEADVERLMERASLVVLPYLEASQSGVGVQAIGRGIPIVVTDVGGLPDLALDSTFVVPAGDAAALARALLRHLDHAVAIRERTLAQARDLVGWDCVAHKALRIYDELVRIRASGRSAVEGP
jgi:glycosyltransferase involved in cell wall biosynthesis